MWALEATWASIFLSWRVFRILCFLILSGGVELFIETDHELTHGLFPVLDGHGPTLTDIASAQV